MKIFCNIAAVLAFVLASVLGATMILLMATTLNTIGTTYDVGQMVQLKIGGTGMVTDRGLYGYRVRIGHEEIWYQEFELEEL